MIVVTGAAGRLGRRVVQLLADLNREILATDQVEADDLPAEFVRCDLGNAEVVGDILKGAEAVVHMGAIPGPSRAEPRVIFENNVAADFNVMISAAELGLRRVVFLVQCLRHGVGARRERLRSTIPAVGRGTPDDAL